MTFYEFLNLVATNPEASQAALRLDSSLLDIRNGPGETALHYFAVENDLPRVRFLHEFGSDLNTVDHFGSSPLMHAVQCDYSDLIEWLLVNGSNVDLKTVNHDTALSLAVLKGNEAHARRILRECKREIQYYFDYLDAAEVVNNPSTDIRRLIVDLGLIDPCPLDDDIQ